MRRRACLVFGVNTDVGKSVFSSGLARFGPRGRTAFLKPLQTGTDEGHSDARTVTASSAPGAAGSDVGVGGDTLFAWGAAVSPHVAAEREGWAPSDGEVIERVGASLHDLESKNDLVIVETAGGVLSPGPNRTPQADMYAELDTAVLLVGDGNLGGISGTLAAHECLMRRGYRVPIVAIIEDEVQGYGNSEYLSRFFSEKQADASKVFKFPALPPQPEPLFGWFDENEEQFQAMIRYLLDVL